MFATFSAAGMGVGLSVSIYGIYFFKCTWHAKELKIVAFQEPVEEFVSVAFLSVVSVL